MLWLISIVAILLLAGPLRRVFFGAWRFTIPLVVSIVVGLDVGAFLVGFGLPPYVILMSPVAAVLVVMPAIRAWLNENIGDGGRRP